MTIVVDPRYGRTARPPEHGGRGAGRGVPRLRKRLLAALFLAGFSGYLLGGFWRFTEEVDRLSKPLPSEAPFLPPFPFPLPPFVKPFLPLPFPAAFSSALACASARNSSSETSPSLSNREAIPVSPSAFFFATADFFFRF